MCGLIAAMALTKVIDLPQAQLELARDTLVHRGPDAGGLWLAPSGQAALGHRRLSIIDLPTGRQPITNETGTIGVVVNGEFYGYPEIRRELGHRGHQFKTGSDSEIVVHLYEERGPDCLAELRGEFAFVLWDDRARRLLAARDRFGIKPLYYTVHQEVLFLASEVKALLALGVPPVWDEEIFYRLSHFIGHPGDPGRTLFKGIYQIPPGYLLTAAAGPGVQLQPYWDLDYPLRSELLTASEADIIAETRRLLTEAVELRLEADVPVTFYLSGGLDSSAVVGLAASRLTQPLEAFTICFDEADYNEFAFARQTAERWQVALQPIAVTPRLLADNLARVVYHSECLFCNTNGVAKFIMSQAVQAAGYKVVLSGDGGDEVFAGYPGFVQDMLRYGNGYSPDQAAPLLAQLQRHNHISQGLLVAHGEAGELGSLQDRLGFVPGWLAAFASTGRRLQPFLRPDFLAQFNGRDIYETLLDSFDFGQLAGREPLAIAMYTWNKTVLPYYILLYETDRVDMAHSLEGRLPLLDHKLVEYVRNVPARLLIKGATEKYLLKEAARPWLTEPIYQRIKHPFYAPAIGLAPEGPLYQLARDIIGSRAFGETFFEPAEAIRLLDSLPRLEPAEIIALDPIVTLMLVTALFQQQFGLAHSS